MSDLVQQERSQKALIHYALYGVFSGVLYLTYALAFLFLAPLQYAYACKGKKAGLVASGTSIVLIAAGMLFGLNGVSTASPGWLAVSVLPPLVLMCALWFINSGIGKMTEGQRVVVSSAVLCVVAWPFLNKILANGDLISALQSMVQESLNSISGSQIDASIVRSTLDLAVKVIRSAFAPMLLVFMSINWGLGNSFARAKAFRTGAVDPAKLQKRGAINVYVPFSLLWPTLLAWTGLFLVVALKKDGPVAWVVWNVALFLAALYAAQGFGIVDFFLRHLRIGGLIRLLLPLVIVFCFLNQTVATVVLIALPLLGITEVWFPYRNFKGVRL